MHHGTVLVDAHLDVEPVGRAVGKLGVPAVFVRQAVQRRGTLLVQLRRARVPAEERRGAVRGGHLKRDDGGDVVRRVGDSRVARRVIRHRHVHVVRRRVRQRVRRDRRSFRRRRRDGERSAHRGGVALVILPGDHLRGGGRSRPGRARADVRLGGVRRGEGDVISRSHLVGGDADGECGGERAETRPGHGRVRLGVPVLEEGRERVRGGIFKRRHRASIRTRQRTHPARLVVLGEEDHLVLVGETRRRTQPVHGVIHDGVGDGDGDASRARAFDVESHSSVPAETVAYVSASEHVVFSTTTA